MLSLKDAAIKKTALTHMGINLTVVALYVVNAYLRNADPQNAGLPFALSVVAILMLLVSGWLGGKMVYMAGVGVTATEGSEATSTASVLMAQAWINFFTLLPSKMSPPAPHRSLRSPGMPGSGRISPAPAALPFRRNEPAPSPLMKQ